jgi:hypothetical protein
MDARPKIDQEILGLFAFPDILCFKTGHEAVASGVLGRVAFTEEYQEARAQD